MGRTSSVVTSWPWATKWRARCRPRKPAPPETAKCIASERNADLAFLTPRRQASEDVGPGPWTAPDKPPLASWDLVPHGASDRARPAGRAVGGGRLRRPGADGGQGREDGETVTACVGCGTGCGGGFESTSTAASSSTAIATDASPSILRGYVPTPGCPCSTSRRATAWTWPW